MNRVMFSDVQMPTTWTCTDFGAIEFKTNDDARKAEALFNELQAEINRLRGDVDRPTEAVRSMPDEVRGMLEALRSYEQADPDGVFVKVSRAAVDEAVELIAARYAPLQK